MTGTAYAERVEQLVATARPPGEPALLEEGFELLLGEEEAGRTRFPLLTLADLEQLPEPAWLLEGLLPVGGAVMLYAAPGVGKSFVALDWALSMASGHTEWFGRALRPGRVVYVAAEGLIGLKRRVRAWCQIYGRASIHPEIQFVGEALQLLRLEDAAALAAAVRALGRPPALVVLDTLARMTPGGDENAVADTGRAIASIDHLRHTTGACVLALHHTQKAGELERGSGNWRAAMDAMLTLKEEDGGLELRPTKQRDGELIAPIRLALHAAGGSLVVARTGLEDEDRLSARDREVLTAIGRLTEPGGEPVPTHQWCKVTAIPERTFYLAVKRLRTLGLVEVYRRSYRITLAGTARLQ